MMYYYGYGLFGFFLMMVFWIAIIWLIIWVIQQITKNKESDFEILNKRFARGEINKKEYLEKKKMLK